MNETPSTKPNRCRVTEEMLRLSMSKDKPMIIKLEILSEVYFFFFIIKKKSLIHVG